MLFRFLPLATVIALLLSSPLAANEALTLDPEKSKIDFVGRKTDGKHVGGFKSFKVKSVANFDDPSASTLEIEIDTNSLWSDNDKLTNHLKNPDFFDVRKFPKLTFKATKIAAEDESDVKITGDMTMLGKTVAVTVPCEVESIDDKVHLVAKFKIDRTKWGMNYGVGNIENDVEITATLVLAR
ncbi:MAG: YceI family protein [Planctomycetaceae bacterium]|nr:MAG: YceI family protein [Planctomycetaceae bacterium]